MKKIKTKHGMNKSVKDFIRFLTHQCVAMRTTNNWKKMHGKPMRRRGGVYYDKDLF